eukprot:ANDGO_03554.mRNA.1 hypothetical protein ACA1_027500
MRQSVFCVAAALLFVPCVLAHLCMMTPHQRGDLHLGNGGDRTCFRPQPPCGGTAYPPAAPTVTLQGGSTFKIEWQQNFNHYQPGNPGSMVVQIATSQDVPDNQWTELGVVPDINPHMQWTQTNFSLVASIPNINCDSCVLRIRYIPHKPTEPIFHQCSDVKVVRSSTANDAVTSADSKYFILGVQPKGDSAITIVDVNPYVGVRPLFDIPFAVRSVLSPSKETPAPNHHQHPEHHDAGKVAARGCHDEHPGHEDGAPSAPSTAGSVDLGAAMPFIADQVFAYDSAGQRLYFTGSFGDVGSAPTYLVVVDLSTSSHVARNMSLTVPFSALTFDTVSKTLIGFAYLPSTTTPGSFNFLVQRIDPSSLSITTLYTGADEDTFVNMMWMEIDSENQKLYLLQGDENAPDTLRSKMFVIDVHSGQLVQSWIPDFSQFTFSSFHLDTRRKMIVAASPGLSPFKAGNGTWSLVQIHEDSSVTELAEIAPAGEYAIFYGGSVAGADFVQGRFFQYLVDKSDPSTVVMAVVDYVSGAVKFSSPLGPLNTVHNMVYA